MKLQQHTHQLTFRQGKSSFSFLPSGDVFAFTQDGLMINGYRGCPKEGSLNNLWLRVYQPDGVHACPLLGIRSRSALFQTESGLLFEGRAEGVAYRATFRAAGEGLWFWDVSLEGGGQTADVVYGQDAGVASAGDVLSNELYTAQYLGHTVLQGEHGYVVCSRQNMPQDSRFPYLQQGMSRGRAVGFSTDGMQFFGPSYKAAQVPAALGGDLPNVNSQFELSYIALQSEKIHLRGRAELSFYGLFRPSHPDAVTELEFADTVRAAASAPAGRPQAAPCPAVRIGSAFGAPYCSPQADAGLVDTLFPQRRLEERQGGRLFSFFTPAHTHVALQEKERLLERPQGHIISSLFDPRRVGGGVITSTNYMYGLFNGQTVVGNTSFHKLFSVARGLLDNQKHTGQRLYLRLDGRWRLLTLPALYEMGLNFARWYYLLPQDDLLVVTSFTAAERPDVVLDVRSTAGRAYDFLLTQQLVLGENEFEQPVRLEETGEGGKTLRLSPDPDVWQGSPYPGLHYDLQFPGADFTWSDDRVFFEDGIARDGTLLTVRLGRRDAFRCVIQGRLEEESPAPAPSYDFDAEAEKFRSFYRTLTCGFRLEKQGEGADEVEKLNEIAGWFSHNAMTHFAAPHGLEQSGGAAWGTRDVCQGPMEYFLATQNDRLARAVLLTVFAHQVWESGEWPQWFMFDRYTANAGECHGDVVLWPLKAAGDYLEQTGDFSILHEPVAYMRGDGAHAVGRDAPLLAHVMRATATLEKRFLAGTALISYAGGDWDDTLQPADPSLRENLVSSWTQALAYQVFALLGRVLAGTDAAYAAHLRERAEAIGAAFRDDLVQDGVVAGFVCRQADGSFRCMLHPQDEVTGIRYRLLPMTRSIIAELAGKEQAARSVRLIEQHLSFPDGVRTMDRPARYEGGVSRIFKRAEQAANVGREVSLQYTHAHIRYVESMAKYGDDARAWKGLLQVNPINIREAVPNAVMRQSNVYFSSSDGLFPDRCAYSRDFEKLYDGSVAVRSGWRLYSSGPGIYLHQLISNVLGVRFAGGDLVLDPVLPHTMDGLRFTFACFGRETVFVYHVAPERRGGVRAQRDGDVLAGRALPNPYRPGGILIPRTEFMRGGGPVDVFLT